MSDICPWLNDDVEEVKSDETPAQYEMANGKKSGLKKGSINQVLSWLFLDIEDGPFIEESCYFLHSYINLYTGSELLNHIKETYPFISIYIFFNFLTIIIYQLIYINLILYNRKAS